MLATSTFTRQALRSSSHVRFNTTSALATSSNVSSPTVTPGRSIVPQRSLLSLEGPQALTLLQGLVTANVKNFAHGQPPIYGAFLQPAGRLVSTFFLHALPSEQGAPHVLLDIDARSRDAVLAFIKRFKLRSKVKLSDASEAWKVEAGWGGAEWPGGVGGVDVRTPLMGWRRVEEASTEPETTQDPHAYLIHRLMQGVPDGPDDLPEGSSLPLEANIDWMGGVDYRKGCYVGQELTARTHHTGVVRKRIVPVSLYKLEHGPPTTHHLDAAFPITAPPPGTDIRSASLASSSASCAPVPRRGRPSGRLLSSHHNIGLALLRLEHVHKVGLPSGGLTLSLQTPEGVALGVRPWLPYWWPEEGKLPLAPEGE